MNILPVLFGLLSATFWGAADFGGGLVSKRTSAYGAVILGHTTGLVLLLALAAIFREPLPPLEVWLWGGAAGLGGGFGLMFLYRALAEGRMSVAAPISAIVAVIIPLLVGAVMDGLPGAWTIVGFALALAAVWLISRREQAAVRLKALSMPVAAGLLCGLFFICVHQASQESVIWPIVAVRLTSITSLLVYALRARRPWLPQRAHWPLVILSGVLDIGGNVCYVLAGQIGRLDVATALGSLYPGSTVILACLILHERITRPQAAGVLLALVAIVLIAL